MKTFIKIDKGLTKLFTLLGYGAGLIGAFMMLLSVANVVARQIFMAPLFGTVEIVSYCGLLLGAGALAYNELGDGNITMTLFTDMMKPVMKATVDLVGNLIAAVFYGAIAYRYWAEIFTTFRKATTTQVILLPLWIVNLVMCIGFAFATVALLLKAARGGAYLVWGEKLKEAQNEGGAKA